MAHEPEAIDISNQPELLRLVEEVRASGKPRRLRRNGEDVALLPPRPAKRHAHGDRRRRFTREDSLFTIIGIATGPDDGVTDVSTNKYKYLAEAYLAKPE